jgi:hypothetical protein
MPTAGEGPFPVDRGLGENTDRTAEEAGGCRFELRPADDGEEQEAERGGEEREADEAGLGERVCLERVRPNGRLGASPVLEVGRPEAARADARERMMGELARRDAPEVRAVRAEAEQVRRAGVARRLPLELRPEPRGVPRHDEANHGDNRHDHRDPGGGGAAWALMYVIGKSSRPPKKKSVGSAVARSLTAAASVRPRARRRRRRIGGRRPCAA